MKPEFKSWPVQLQESDSYRHWETAARPFSAVPPSSLARPASWHGSTPPSPADGLVERIDELERDSVGQDRPRSAGLAFLRRQLERSRRAVPALVLAAVATGGYYLIAAMQAAYAAHAAYYSMKP